MTKIQKYNLLLKRKSIKLFLMIFFINFFFIGFGFGVFNIISQNLPDLAQLDSSNSKFINYWGLPTRVYDRNGELLAEFWREKRDLITISDVPDTLVKAFVATEDRNFYNHHGINFKRIIKAILVNIKTGRKKEGASTITQQLARALFLTKRKTYIRKLKEMVLSIKIEKRFTKTEILEGYFNKIFFGHNAYGIKAAARLYFGKNVSDLNLGECAILAGLPKAPNTYSPFRHPDKARKRQKIVLDSMVKMGYITESQKQQTIIKFWSNFGKQNNDNNQLNFRSSIKNAPYFSQYILKWLKKRYSTKLIFQGGLQVYTTLNLNYQKKAQEVLIKHIEDYRNTIKKPNNVAPEYLDEQIQGSLLTIDPKTGDILTMLGGSQWSIDNQINRCTIYPGRQPGSSFKPFVYAAAFETKKYTPATTILDAPIYFKEAYRDNWVPENYEKKYFGRITLRTALVKSLNVSTIKLFQKIGAKRVISLAKKAGISAKLRGYWSLALGAQEIKMIELINAYSIFANKGLVYPYKAVNYIKDRNGKIIFENSTVPKQVISPAAAYLLTNVLSDVPKPGGTAFRVGRILKNRPIAGKTGTTNDYRDAWFIGYTPNLVTGVWVGYDRGNISLGRNNSGGRLAGPIWAEYMKSILDNTPLTRFEVPDNTVEFRNVCSVTGKLATDNCPTKREVFIKGTAPHSYCKKHLSN